MASNRVRRVTKELAEIQKDTLSRVTVETVGSDTTQLKGSFEGPPGTPYEGGTYLVSIQIPNEYPFRPPVMKFSTKIWHPNVSSQTGAICLDTLGNAWSPVFTIKSAMLSIQSLLSTPEPKDPQDAEVASMLLKNPTQFNRIAKEWAVRYAGATNNGEVDSNADFTTGDEGEKGDETISLEAYDGYNKNLVDRFVDMGFDVRDVVTAFRRVGIHRMGGMEYELEENYMNAITTQLLPSSS